MASYGNSSLSGMMSDYTHLRTLPALLSVVFVVAGLYQFGGISEVHLNWGLNYTLTSETATIASIAVFAAAFMSSETRDFDAYEDWEMAMIGLSPILIVGYQYVGFVTETINSSSPTLSIVAFLVTVVGWGVAVR
jgi:hypothetical protein